ncbi:alkylglycerol monooxygenase isoform X2 [Rhinatrema bivittatum]|uniref:alkylglycerol monooxygenase isoform X2 n=1 Tax=Rhinatrema bivittatum TaxID=194408 RepID=UPI00112DA9B7|nr:alkylglycerol monooxygenase isoform X2 [Rhinatrema bivittatum]
MTGFSGHAQLSVSQGARLMFYALQPNESAFRSVEEVPDYVEQATPYFISMLMLELILSWAWKGQPFRINDGLSSLSAGVLSRLPDVLSRGVELTSYIYIWNNYRLFELPWDSPWTWWLTFIGVDFGYYWFHRMAHEVNILWAAHQAHHSAEDYNLTTALRQSVLQKYTSWIFYWPLALFLPPSVYAVHLQFNLLYQFWIHTEMINNLGPLELILNTPSHHRVHHGRNPYCIDSNYGGTLIIWDRLFGTFVPENEKIMYGLTHPINTFEPFQIQLHHLFYIWSTFWDTPGICNKLSVVFKGPGWGPGKPRLGLPEEIPLVTGKELPYNPKMPVYLQVYTVVQFIIMMGYYQHMFAAKLALSQIALLLRIFYIILTLTSIGFLVEERPNAAILETVRCCTFLVLHKYGFLTTDIISLVLVYELEDLKKKARKLRNLMGNG